MTMHLVARRRWRAPARIALAAGLLAHALPAQAQCLAGVTCGYSISGKKGGFLERQVAAATVEKAQAQIAQGTADGRALAASSLNQGRISGEGIRMPQTEARLAELLAIIAKGWPERLAKPPPFTVRVLGTTEYAPVAHPDMVITVPLGVLKRVDNDDELVWLLAHEYSHFALRHFARDAEHHRKQSAITHLIDCTRDALQLAQMRASVSSTQINITQSNDPHLQAASLEVWAKGELLQTALDGMNQYFSREQEDEADVAGYDLARKAEYSKDGFTQALTKFEQEEAMVPGMLKQFSDGMDTRMKQEAGKATASLLSGGFTGVFTQMGSSVLGAAKHFATKALFDEAMKSHRSAKSRLSGLSKYEHEAYPASDSGDFDSRGTWLKSVRALGEYQSALATVDALEQAKTMVTKENCGALPLPVATDAAQAQAAQATIRACYDRVIAKAHEALQSLRPALQSPWGHTPLVANVVARLYEKVGQVADADRTYSEVEQFERAPASRVAAAARSRKGRTAVAAPAPAALAPLDYYYDQSKEGFGEHIRLLVTAGDYARAGRLIDFAKARIGDDEPFLPYVVMVALRTRNLPVMLDALSRCAASGDSEVRTKCSAFMLDPHQQETVEKLPPEQQDKIRDASALAAAELRRQSTCGINPLGNATK